MRASNPTQGMVRLGMINESDDASENEFALQSPRPLAVATQSLPADSGLGLSSPKPVAKVGVLARNLNHIGSLDGPDTELERHAPNPSVFRTDHNLPEDIDDYSLLSSLGPWIRFEDVSEQTPDLASSFPSNVMVGSPTVAKPLVSKELSSIIPVSGHIYAGVSSEGSQPEVFEAPDYFVHGFFDGTTLKLSSRARREARPGGPSRRILSESDLDQYCTGMQAPSILFS